MPDGGLGTLTVYGLTGQTPDQDKRLDDYISTMWKTYQSMAPGPDRDALLQSPEFVGALQAKGMPTVPMKTPFDNAQEPKRDAYFGDNPVNMPTGYPAPPPLSVMARYKAVSGPTGSVPVYGRQAVPPDMALSDIERNAGVAGATILSKPHKTGADIPVMSRIVLGEKPEIRLGAKGDYQGWTHSMGDLNVYPPKPGGGGSEKTINWAEEARKSDAEAPKLMGAKTNAPVDVMQTWDAKDNNVLAAQKIVNALNTAYRVRFGDMAKWSVEKYTDKVSGKEKIRLKRWLDPRVEKEMALNVRDYVSGGSPESNPEDAEAESLINQYSR